MNSTARLRAWLQQPVDASSVNILRIALGLLISYGALRFLAKGWVSELLILPQYRFYYYGFSWVPRLGETASYALLGAVAVLGVLVAVGWRYRISVALLFLTFSWLELLDVSTYLNHYYLISCLLLLLVWLPTHQLWSLDVLHGRVERREGVPRWVLFTLRTQIGLVYVFAGIAKLKSDWLFEAEPLTTWLYVRSEMPIVGPVLAHPAAAYVFSWAGAVYDLTIVGFLLWRRTRMWAYAAVIGFHAVTGALFHIGVFPIVMITLSTIFFEPSWPRRLFTKFRREQRNETALERTLPTPAAFKLVPAGVALFLAFQVAWPLRQWAYPGNPMWTEQGFRFSWNVMLVEKAGQVEFEVRDPHSGRHWITSGRTLLTPLQYKVMSTQPDLILQFAHLLAERYRDKHRLDNVEVYADVWVSLNGRERQRLIDPSVDLAHTQDGFAPKRWILPLSSVLERRILAKNDQR